MTLAELRSYVRDLTGVFSADVVTNAMIDRLINEAYNELANLRDWDWLEDSYQGTVPAFTNGKHTITLSGGTRRIISAYLIVSEAVIEMEEAPTLDTIERQQDKVKYDVNFAGQFTFAPEQDPTAEVKIRYSRANVALASDGSSPAFDGQFHNILAYRTAIKVLGFISDDSKRADFYAGEYSSLLEGMISLYELSHDYRSIQMGGDGQRTRKYFPWFRPA